MAALAHPQLLFARTARQPSPEQNQAVILHHAGNTSQETTVPD